ncbi:MAG: glycine zipper 2TM domain-containing protein [Azospirillaceae bacterium]
MKAPIRLCAALIAVSLPLAACQNTEQTVGGIGGAVLGGIVGSQIGGGAGRVIATGIGAAVGGLLGSEVGRRLGEADRERNGEAAFETYETGTTQSWSNPDSGASGTVEPVGQPTAATGGAQCQIQESTVTLEDGTTDTTRYRLCKRGDEFYTEPV